MLVGHIQSTAVVPLSKVPIPPDAQSGPCNELAIHPGVYPGPSTVPMTLQGGGNGHEEKKNVLSFFFLFKENDANGIHK